MRHNSLNYNIKIAYARIPHGMQMDWNTTMVMTTTTITTMTTTKMTMMTTTTMTMTTTTTTTTVTMTMTTMMMIMTMTMMVTMTTTSTTTTMMQWNQWTQLYLSGLLALFKLYNTPRYGSQYGDTITKINKIMLSWKTEVFACLGFNVLHQKYRFQSDPELVRQVKSWF